MAAGSDRRILLCGASVRSLAASAIRSGWQPWCADFFGDDDLRRLLQQHGGQWLGRITRYPQVLPLTRHVPCGIPLLWTGGLENFPELLTAVQNVRPVPGLDAAAIRQVRDPFLLGTALQAAGLQFPPSVRDIDHSKRRPDSPGRPLWLWKRTASAGGLGVLDHHAVSPWPSVSDGANLREPGYYQERIAGVPMSAVFVATETGTQLVGCSLQLTGWRCLHAQGFQFCGNLGPMRLTPVITAEIQRAGQVVADWSGLRGVFGMDFILQQGRPWFLEVNPRITASHELYEQEGGWSLLMAHLAVCGGNLGRTDEMSGGNTALHEGFRFTRQSAVMLRLIVCADRCVAADSVFHDLRDNIGTPPQASGREIPASGTDSGDKSGGRLWLADVPAAGEQLQAGVPACSIYGIAASATDIPEVVWSGDDARQESSAAGRLCRRLSVSRKLVAAALSDLLTQFSAHRTSTNLSDFQQEHDGTIPDD